MQNKINNNMEALITLIEIIKNGRYDEFSKLLQGKQLQDKNILNIFVNGQTALHYSLIHGRSLAWCKKLVSCGADPHLMNRDGWHPIHLAAYTGSRETMVYLLDKIKDSDYYYENNMITTPTPTTPTTNNNQQQQQQQPILQ